MARTNLNPLPHGELTRLARLTGASLTHLHFIFRRQRLPNQQLAEKLAELGYPVWSLYPGLKRTAQPAAMQLALFGVQTVPGSPQIGNELPPCAAASPSMLANNVDYSNHISATDKEDAGEHQDSHTSLTGVRTGRKVR